MQGSSLIELSLAIFPWADCNRSKAAMKLHVGLDHGGHFPAFATITDGIRHDVPVERRGANGARSALKPMPCFGILKPLNTETLRRLASDVR
jgi:hypothetical protein